MFCLRCLFFPFLLLACSAPLAALRVETATKQLDGQELKVVTRYLDFGDDTQLRFKTSHFTDSRDLVNRQWGDYFFGLTFGRHGNGSWDAWDFLRVNSLEGTRRTNFMRQQLPDAVSLFRLPDQTLADFSWSHADGRQLLLQIRKFQQYPDYLFFRILWQGDNWQDPSVTLAAYPGNSDRPPERERWAASREDCFALAAGNREFLPQSDGIVLFNRYRYEEFGNLLVVQHERLEKLSFPKTNYHVRVILQPKDAQSCLFALSYFKNQDLTERMERFLQEEADSARQYLDQINWEPQLDPKPLQRWQEQIQSILTDLSAEPETIEPSLQEKYQRLLAAAEQALAAKKPADYGKSLVALQQFFEHLVQIGLQQYR